MSLSDTNAAASKLSSAEVYQYSSQGNVRARAHSSAELLLDMKLVQQSDANPEYLARVGGQAGEARAAGFELGFIAAADIGFETLNESTGLWRPVNSTTTFAIIASLPN